MTPYHTDDWLTVYVGDCRQVLAELEPESVHCVVTSPPYYGLRDYGTASWSGGDDPTCDHIAPFVPRAERASGDTNIGRGGSSNDAQDRGAHAYRDTCRRCGAIRADAQIGLEPTPEAYVDSLVAVFREVRRVLRKDGVAWLNLGDSYADRANRRSDGEAFRRDRADVVPPKRNTLRGEFALKAKDRMMIPARVALALQADGWWLRDEVIWSKPNPMPSSVEDRTTPAHEMVYLLTRSARYAYDADAIRERAQSGPSDIRKMLEGRQRIGGLTAAATDPLLAGSSLTNVGRMRGVGGKPAPARDKTAVDPNLRGLRQAPEPGEPDAFHPLGRNKRSVWTVATQPYAEAHFATFPEALIEPMILAGCPPAGVVLDPFGGSGTVALVAERLGRRAVLVDLSPEYAGQMLVRIGAGRSRGSGPAVDLPVPFAQDGLWGEVPA